MVLRRVFYLLPATWRDVIKFVFALRYWPDLKKPSTYNEKINLRKRDWNNKLFVLCSDKIAVRKYVEEKVGRGLLIDEFFFGKNITVNELRSLVSRHGAVLVKANHNSGPVQFANAQSTEEELKAICLEIEKQLSIDYGKVSGETWYSKIERGVLVERNIAPVEGGLLDYKFHVFKNSKGEQKVLVHIDFGRNLQHRRSYFDSDLNFIPFRVSFPLGEKYIDKPVGYDSMLEVAKALAQPFSYARVDLYNVSGRIYFGELTFAPGSGRSRFYPKERDLWMGGLWEEDPRL